MEEKMDIEGANQYVSSGLSSVTIKLVRSVDEIDSNVGFPPDMCHQVFGENEIIFGYQNLKINIYYNAVTFQCFVDVKYDSKLEKSNKSELEAENVMEKLNPWLPADFITKRDEFCNNLLNTKNNKPFGVLLDSYCTDEDRKFEVYACNIDEPDYQEFHQRMETLIVWFIDAANFIDIDDHKWQFYIIYETVGKQHFPVGYATVYEYFCYPDNRRYRISQFIIFPPFQCLGLGTFLLETLYKHLSNYTNIFDITVEDPSDKFQKIRDYVDCKLCSTLPPFSLPQIKGDFSSDMIKIARDKFKINEKQSRRVYEILRLLHTDIENENEYNSYKLMVKRRLNAPFKKQQDHNKKLVKFIKEVPLISLDHQKKLIEKNYQNLVKQYRHIIYRLQKT